MLRSKLHSLRNDDEGFTLIELLVVILIIGILAAIALPSFLGQSDKAKDASAKSNARNAVTQIESCVADGGDNTATALCATSGTTGNPDLVQFEDTAVASTGVGTYTITATSKTTATFTITKTAPGGYARTCGPTARQGKGGCPANGIW